MILSPQYWSSISGVIETELFYLCVLFLTVRAFEPRPASIFVGSPPWIRLNASYICILSVKLPWVAYCLFVCCRLLIIRLRRSLCYKESSDILISLPLYSKDLSVFRSGDEIFEPNFGREDMLCISLFRIFLVVLLFLVGVKSLPFISSIIILGDLNLPNMDLSSLNVLCDILDLSPKRMFEVLLLKLGGKFLTLF